MGINWRLSTLLACWQPAQWEKLNRRDHSEVGRTFGEFLGLDKISFVAQTTADSARRELASSTSTYGLQ
jgi:hypothetical protein